MHLGCGDCGLVGQVFIVARSCHFGQTRLVLDVVNSLVVSLCPIGLHLFFAHSASVERVNVLGRNFHKVVCHGAVGVPVKGTHGPCEQNFFVANGLHRKQQRVRSRNVGQEHSLAVFPGFLVIGIGRGRFFGPRIDTDEHARFNFVLECVKGQVGLIANERRFGRIGFIPIGLHLACVGKVNRHISVNVGSERGSPTSVLDIDTANRTDVGAGLEFFPVGKTLVCYG